jgi:hypothetical protein
VVAGRMPPGRVLDPANPPNLRQQQLSLAIDVKAWLDLLERVPPLQRARLRACAADHAAAWVTADPDPFRGLHLEAPQFRMAVQLWLGVPVGDPGACPYCVRSCDALGTHALECTAAGHVTRRHNDLRDVVLRVCQQAGLRPEAEKAGLLPGHLRRPADIYLPRWPGGGAARIALDFAVVSPLQRKFLAQSGAMSLAAAEAYADQKALQEETEAACRREGISFEPIVVETWGGWCQGAQRVLRAIGRAWAMRQGVREEAGLQLLYQQLSVTLLRSNAQAAIDRAAGTVPDPVRASAVSALSYIQSLCAADELEEGMGLDLEAAVVGAVAAAASPGAGAVAQPAAASG